MLAAVSSISQIVQSGITLSIDDEVLYPTTPVSYYVDDANLH